MVNVIDLKKFSISLAELIDAAQQHHELRHVVYLLECAQLELQNPSPWRHDAQAMTARLV
ncbi:hypothetical protein [Variibacter gotjawalensis]|uniref:hypothetical protein n=1 Tax=Variibacter gotjawalensis TaxID=1333996 RepID=UPI000BBAFC61|nr:hypothetical protein [Variibacter gotjawalensis]NIK47286.1 hypothetical protein [Variibacter gotjawalensis]